MEVLRLIHHKHYDNRLKRFRSTAFSNSSNDGGISVIDRECAESKTGHEETLCNHVLEFYPVIAGKPIIYWTINLSHLEKQYSDLDLIKEYVPSENGDTCHVNLKGISKNRASKYFKKFGKPPSFSICQDMSPTQLDPLIDIEDYIVD